jgi:hypothetical protein
MHEVMIERWNNRDGSQDVLWSVWQDGKRVHMGGPLPTADAAEAEARAFCRKALGREPDRVTTL